MVAWLSEIRLRETKTRNNQCCFYYHCLVGKNCRSVVKMPSLRIKLRCKYLFQAWVSHVKINLPCMGKAQLNYHDPKTNIFMTDKHCLFESYELMKHSYIDRVRLKQLTFSINQTHTFAHGKKTSCHKFPQTMRVTQKELIVPGYSKVRQPW